MLRASLGDQELEILRHVSEHGSRTVGEVVDGYGTPHELSRSTIVTVMERLRKKRLSSPRQSGRSVPVPLLGGSG